MTIKLNAATGGGSVSLSAPNSTTSNLDVALTLPTSDGDANQFLKTDGTGTLSWAAASTDIISEGNTSAEVIDTGSDGRFVVTTEGTERARVDSSGRLLVGTATARENLYNSSLTALEQIESTSSPRIAVISSSNVNGRGGAIVLAHQVSDTIGGNSLLASGDQIGAITFQGSDGAEFVEGATIKAEVDGTPGANDMPGRIIFSTTADGASSPTERVRIDQEGRFYNTNAYNSTTATAANLVVQSDGRFIRSSSSRKYKTDIESIQDSYSDALLNCRPVWYRSTTAADNPDWGWWGFIAEEVAEIDPRLVHWKTTEPVVQENGSLEHIPCEPEPEGVAYERFVPHLLNLIKRQKEAIETLEASNADLAARLTALEGGAS